MKLIKTFVILFFGCLITFFSCTDEDDSEIVTMKVNHYKQSVPSFVISQYLLVQEGDAIGGDDWSFFYGGIEGFNYELGNTFTLKVEKETIENPPIDGNSIRYKLLKEISKVKAPSDVSFEIFLSRVYDDGNFEKYFKEEENSTFKLFDGTKIDCNTLCDELTEKLTAKDAITGVFKHSNSNELLLIDIK